MAAVGLAGRRLMLSASQRLSLGCESINDFLGAGEFFRQKNSSRRESFDFLLSQTRCDDLARIDEIYLPF